MTMTVFLRLAAMAVALYAVLASDSIAEETNGMIWALWIYAGSIAVRMEEINAKGRE